jgi:hypothetical protein
MGGAGATTIGFTIRINSATVTSFFETRSTIRPPTSTPILPNDAAGHAVNALDVVENARTSESGSFTEKTITSRPSPRANPARAPSDRNVKWCASIAAPHAGHEAPLLRVFSTDCRTCHKGGLCPSVPSRVSFRSVRGRGHLWCTGFVTPHWRRRARRSERRADGITVPAATNIKTIELAREASALPKERAADVIDDVALPSRCAGADRAGRDPPTLSQRPASIVVILVATPMVAVATAGSSGSSIERA